jgi:hypothetical protein
MLRSALPSRYRNISEVKLATWASLAMGNKTNFLYGPQGSHICDVCLKEFCVAAAFTGNPDIAGIGVRIRVT